MIVISDTTPIISLMKANRLDLLRMEYLDKKYKMMSLTAREIIEELTEEMKQLKIYDVLYAG